MTQLKFYPITAAHLVALPDGAFFDPDSIYETDVYTVQRMRKSRTSWMAVDAHTGAIIARDVSRRQAISTCESAAEYDIYSARVQQITAATIGTLHNALAIS